MSRLVAELWTSSGHPELLTMFSLPERGRGGAVFSSNILVEVCGLLRASQNLDPLSEQTVRISQLHFKPDVTFTIASKAAKRLLFAIQHIPQFRPKRYPISDQNVKIYTKFQTKLARKPHRMAPHVPRIAHVWEHFPLFPGFLSCSENSIV